MSEVDLNLNMIEELSQATAEYLEKWKTLVSDLQYPDVFSSLLPTAVAWKVEDIQEFLQRADVLRDVSSLIHYAWINGRWVATFCLKDKALPEGIQVVKLMQRRPGSTDAVGLDHLDFYNAETLKDALAQEPNLKWSEENNGEHCKWLSVWFAGTEAKLRTDTVLQVCADELVEFQTNVIKGA